MLSHGRTYSHDQDVGIDPMELNASQYVLEETTLVKLLTLLGPSDHVQVVSQAREPSSTPLISAHWEPVPEEAPHSSAPTVKLPLEMVVYWPHSEACRGSSALLGVTEEKAKDASKGSR